MSSERSSTAAPPEADKASPVRAAELGLTRRQGEVLAMVLRGLPNKRIACALNVTEATVKEHVSGILLRLGLANRVEAIVRLHGRTVEP